MEAEAGARHTLTVQINGLGPGVVRVVEAINYRIGISLTDGHGCAVADHMVGSFEPLRWKLSTFTG